MNSNINPFEIESLRLELEKKIQKSSSLLFKLSLLNNYFERILSFGNRNYESAFLTEFLRDYYSYIKNFEIWGADPEISIRIIKVLESLHTKEFTREYYSASKFESERLTNQINELKTILSGQSASSGQRERAYFPLIDNGVTNYFYGVVDSITIMINKAPKRDNFIIIPSEQEIEHRISEQCQISWQLALRLSKQYIKKTNEYHEIIISFDKKKGLYEGNSLGIALTLSFLDQILKVYSHAYVINIKEQVAFTGGVIESGEVLRTSEEIIKRKVAAVFFSEINTFVFPKCEETYAMMYPKNQTEKIFNLVW